MPLPFVGGKELPFAEYTSLVVRAVQALSKEDKKVLFKASDALMEQVEMLWSFEPSEYLVPQNPLAGAFAYTGEAFKRLSLGTLPKDAVQRARYGLAVVSALYGVVTPQTPIMPYRLEMQSKLAAGDAKNLYALWRPVLTKWLNDQPNEFIVDLCSGEYHKAFVWKEVNKPVVHVDFRQSKNGKLRSISAFSKQARGAMARWIFNQNIQTIFGLASFDKDGYTLYSHEGNQMVFVRED